MGRTWLTVPGIALIATAACSTTAEQRAPGEDEDLGTVSQGLGETACRTAWKDDDCTPTPDGSSLLYCGSFGVTNYWENGRAECPYQWLVGWGSYTGSYNYDLDWGGPSNQQDCQDARMTMGGYTQHFNGTWSYYETRMHGVWVGGPWPCNFAYDSGYGRMQMPAGQKHRTAAAAWVYRCGSGPLCAREYDRFAIATSRP